MFERSRHPEVRGGDHLQIQSVARTDGAELRLSGDLTLATIDGFVDRLRDAETSDVELLVIDLRRLRFLDSVALGALIAADQRSRELGRRLMLITAAGPVERLLAITRLDRTLEIAAEPPEVIEP